MKAHQVKTLVVGVVAAHSITLGAAMLFWPVQTMSLFGWEYRGQTFFPSQAGVFLLLLGVAYAIGAKQRAFARFLVGSKAVAVVFLIGQYLQGAAPNMVLLAAAGDGMMGLAVAAALIWEDRSRRARQARLQDDRTGST